MTVTPGNLRAIRADEEAHLMSQFTLARIAELRGGEYADQFRAAVEHFVQENPLSTWLQRWGSNEGTFLSTLAWDQDHDYGEGLVVEGAMGRLGAAGSDITRGLLNAARLRAQGVSLANLVRGRTCCLVGAWCGYEALLLHAYGAERVHVIEEVPEYAQWSASQMAAFGVEGDVISGSLYTLTPEILDRIRCDFVYCPGVLYHCSDPSVALFIMRLLLNAGGVLAYETMVCGGPEGQGQARYLGPGLKGWNWWAPAGSTWAAMTNDIGFEGTRQVDLMGGRAWFLGVASMRNMLVESGAAGFSRPDLLGLLR